MVEAASGQRNAHLAGVLEEGLVGRVVHEDDPVDVRRVRGIGGLDPQMLVVGMDPPVAHGAGIVEARVVRSLDQQVVAAPGCDPQVGLF